MGLNLAGTNLIAPFVPALQWKYTASASTMSFTMPATAGVYDFRLYQNCSNTKLLATSGPVTVGVVIVPPVSTVVLASQSVTVMVTGGPGGALDWLGLFLATAPDTAYLDWVRMNGTKSTPATGATTGTATFAIPLTGGPWEIRLLSSDGAGHYVRVAVILRIERIP